MNLLDVLASSNANILSGHDSKPYAALAARASSMADQLRHGDSVLLWTNDVDQIVTLVAAGLSRSVNLYIAHRTISKEAISGLASSLGIGWLLDDRELMDIGPSRSDGNGSIFVMTSGTTRAPKVAKHTPESLFATHRKTAKSERSRWLLTYPPTSFAGLQVVFSAALGGADLVIASQRTIPSFLQAAEQHAVTHISGTPTFWRSFLLLMTPERSLRLQQISVGGEAVDQATLDRLRSAFPGARITHIYASTEAGVGFSVNDGKAGIPVEWLETGIGEVRLRLQKQVLEISSPRMLQKYESGEPLPVDSEGWLSTGDLMKREGDRVHFVGRADRRLNVGGFKVSPEEIEAVLMQCDGVADVQVLGLPSPISGQVLAASVIPKPGFDSQAVKTAVQQLAYQRLESFKVPRIVRIVASLTAAESGKKVRQ